MSHHKKPVKPLPPNDKLYLQLANANDEKAYNVLLKAMTKQPFVAQLDIQIPTSDDAGPNLIERLPTELSELLVDYTFQHARMRPSQFLQAKFMNTHVRTGGLLLLSCMNPQGMVVALDGAGNMTLTLDKDIYESLGITGRVSQFVSDRQRSFVEINLREDYMRDGKPGYERLKVCLDRLGEMDFIMAYNNDFDYPQPVDLPEGISGQTFKLRLTAESGPVYDAQPSLSRLQELFLAQVGKKRKLSMTAGDLAEEASELLEKLATMPDHEPGQSTTIFSIQGLLPSPLVKRILSVLRTMPGQTCITAHPFSHAPVTRAAVTAPTTAKKGHRCDERDTQSVLLQGWTAITSASDESMSVDGKPSQRLVMFAEYR